MRLLDRKHFLIGTTRLRNEALVLRDTLDHVGRHADAIVAYDDASTDADAGHSPQSPEGRAGPGKWVVGGGHQGAPACGRPASRVLLQIARAQMQFDWMFCFDADERVTGDVGVSPDVRPSGCDGARVRLFDAYMTPDDHAPYQPGRELLDFRRFFGPGRTRHPDALAEPSAGDLRREHAREPGGLERVETGLYCQHYGKSLSVEHWEETCDYYIRHFPFDTYGRKWLDAKARRSIRQSDFMRPLYEWGDSAVCERGPDVGADSGRRSERWRRRDKPRARARRSKRSTGGGCKAAIKEMRGPHATWPAGAGLAGRMRGRTLPASARSR